MRWTTGSDIILGCHVKCEAIFLKLCSQFSPKHSSSLSSTRRSSSRNDLIHYCKSASFPQSWSTLFSAICIGSPVRIHFQTQACHMLQQWKTCCYSKQRHGLCEESFAGWPETPHNGEATTQTGNWAEKDPGGFHPGKFKGEILPIVISLLFILVSFPFSVHYQPHSSRVHYGFNKD